jgi:alpha-acetolactate decarboxylase
VVQPEFALHDVSGTLVGFWTSEYAKTLSLPGYHLLSVPMFKRHTAAVSRIVSALAVLVKPVSGGIFTHFRLRAIWSMISL